MRTTAELLTLARERLSLTSDRQLAIALGWPATTMSSYRCGRRAMDVEQIEEFAEKTGIDAKLVLRVSVLERKRIRGTDNKRSRPRQLEMSVHA